jgi:diguanylate cyclase
MSIAADAFSFVAVGVAVAAAALTAFGLRQRRYDGWGWWVAACWITTLGAAAGAWMAAPLGPALAAMLLLQWPILALVGLRRFHPRQSLPGRRWLDWLVLGLSSGVALVAQGSEGPLGPLLAMGAMLVTHLYVATVLFMGPGGREFGPVQGLAAVMALVAFAPGIATLAGASTPLVVRAAVAALGAVVLAFVAITLVCERTERQLRDSRRRLRTLANLDTLTQVPNRRHFLELAEQALQRDEPGTAVLLIFDIDHFKQVNDLFGHAAGDRALTLVSSAVLEHLRVQDVPGRQGGDEFVLLLRRTTPHDAFGVAARIVTEVQKRAPAQQLPTISLSFGVVQIGLGESIAAAMRRADQAMYEAKRQGRSRAVVAEGDERQPVFSESQRLGLTPA